MGLNLRLFILEHSLAFKCYLNELKFLKSHQTAQHHVQRPIISGISDQRYMFRLMTFEVLKLVNQFGLYLFSHPSIWAPIPLAATSWVGF